MRVGTLILDPAAVWKSQSGRKCVVVRVFGALTKTEAGGTDFPFDFRADELPIDRNGANTRVGSLMLGRVALWKSLSGQKCFATCSFGVLTQIWAREWIFCLNWWLASLPLLGIVAIRLR